MPSLPHARPLTSPPPVPPSPRSDGLDRCEAAAVACFVGLTMRLTEARFKPLFFRLLEWAHAVPAADSGAQRAQRACMAELTPARPSSCLAACMPYQPRLCPARHLPPTPRPPSRTRPPTRLPIPSLPASRPAHRHRPAAAQRGPLLPGQRPG